MKFIKPRTSLENFNNIKKSTAFFKTDYVNPASPSLIQYLVVHKDKVLTPAGYRLVASIMGGVIGVLSYLAFLK